jgi:hypothetical protein
MGKDWSRRYSLPAAQQPRPHRTRERPLTGDPLGAAIGNFWPFRDGPVGEPARCLSLTHNGRSPVSALGGQ